MNYDRDSMLCTCDVCGHAIVFDGDEDEFLDLGWEDRLLYGEDMRPAEVYTTMCPRCVYEEKYPCERD